MLNVLCWKPAGVVGIINVEADSTPAAVFRAIDTEAPVQVRDGENGKIRRSTTEGLVRDLLDPARRHVQMAVTGPSGVGKSHLIRRLQRRIEGRPGLEVLVIRRLETNLRAILEKIVATLPEADRREFEEELRHAGHSPTSAPAQKAALLDALAQAIQEDAPKTGSGIDPATEEWLLQQLPDFFRDPYLRQVKFLLPDEIASELVDRLFSSREGKRTEERLAFRSENLPLAGIRLEQCAGPVRDIVDHLAFDQAKTIPEVLAIANRNLDRAIARAMNFSGERLIDLMETLRERLKTSGKELVLLFEEFARLQGYDGAMLEALLKQGGPEGGRDICNVRWVIACTAGRYLDLPDTVRSRMDFLVDVSPEDAAVKVASFAGRYLNAVRVGRQGLEKSLADDAPVPNPCPTCPWVKECHDAFGRSEDGYGLYPFNERALGLMAARADPESATRFNPRSFQRNVLRMVLDGEASRLEQGEFPSASLLSALGGASMGAAERAKLLEKSGPLYDRYLALYQLWGGRGLSDPGEAVARAFGLDPLVGLDQGGTVPVADLNRPDSPDKVPSDPPRQTEARRLMLGGWAGGGPLEQNLAQRLRERLYAMVDQAIDWDAEGLSPSVFAGPTGPDQMVRPFRQASINFARQITNVRVPPVVRLELPLDASASDLSFTAMALEALLDVDAAREWRTDSGVAALAAVRELVDRCAAEVVAQIRRIHSEARDWDPVAGAIELLLVGSALAGNFNAQMDDGKLVEAVFAPMPEDGTAADGKLRNTYEGLRKRREALTRIVRAHVSGTKGGQQGRFIDPRPVLEAARRLRRNGWVLTGKPGALQAPYAEVGEIYERIARDIRPELDEERRVRSEWLGSIEDAFGQEANRQKILEAVTRLLDASATAALPMRRGPLEAAKGAFGGVHFGEAVRKARALRGADPPESELASFAQGRNDNAVGASRALAKALHDFVDEGEAEVRVLREAYGVATLEAEMTRLDEALGGLVDELASLGGGS